MNSEQEDAPIRYVVVESDRFADDRDRAVLGFNSRQGPERATLWYKDLAQALDDLPAFPGPLSHGRDEDASDFYGREVRRMFYYGPTRERSGTPVRVLFAVLPPAPDEPPETAEWVIFLLRLLRGGQALAPEEDPA